MNEPIRFAHLSDWHATSLAGAGAALLRPKRLSGWASWALRRRRRHRVEILRAAMRDVQHQNVDQILVTGDLTHVSLPQEFETAAEQLAELGPARAVFLIPGNHDCYVPVDPARSWDHWAEYLASDLERSIDPAVVDCLAASPAPGRAPRHADYPTLRVRGGLAAIGLCSAIPTPIFRAGGELGAVQLERLERLLTALGRAGSCRVVMIHHPITDEGEPARRALRDREALRGVLARAGAELVLHGHKHRRRLNSVAGPAGPIPVIGVPSSSEVGSAPEKRAQYHVYTARPKDSGGGFSIEAEVRGFDAASEAFKALPDRLL